MKVRDLSRDQRSNVSRTFTRRQQRGSNKDMPRSGRPRITLRADDSYLHMTARMSSKSTARMFQVIWHSKLYRWVSGQKLKNRAQNRCIWQNHQNLHYRFTLPWTHFYFILSFVCCLRGHITKNKCVSSREVHERRLRWSKGVITWSGLQNIVPDLAVVRL